MKEVFLYDSIIAILEKAETLGWTLPRPARPITSLTHGVDIEAHALRYLAGRDIITASIEEAQEAFNAFMQYDLAPGDADVKGAIKERLYAAPGDREIALVFAHYTERL